MVFKGRIKRIIHVKFIVSVRHELSYRLHTRFLHSNCYSPLLVWLCLDTLVAQHFAVRDHSALGFAVTFSDLVPPECLTAPGYAVLESSEVSDSFARFLESEFEFVRLRRSEIRGSGNGFVKFYNCKKILKKTEFVSKLEDFFRLNYDKLPSIPPSFCSGFEEVECG